jgi:hypothetical protein
MNDKRSELNQGVAKQAGVSECLPEENRFFFAG